MSSQTSKQQSPDKAKHPVIRETHKQFAAHHINFQFHWCKGHAGISGNEHVDSMAQKGADQLGIFYSRTIQKTKSELVILYQNC